MVEIAFVCTYCGETLAEEADERGVVTCDEFHGCVGETPGYLGEVTERDVLTVEEVDLKIV